MRLIDLADGNALEDFERRGSGHGEGAVRAFHGAGAIVQGGDENFFHAEELETDADADDVGDGIQRTDFVKLHVFRRLAMDSALRDRDTLEDGERMLFDEVRKLAVLDQFPNLAVAATVRVVAMVVMMVFHLGAVTVIVLVAMRMGVFVRVRMFFMAVLVLMMFLAVLMLVPVPVFMRMRVTVLVLMGLMGMTMLVFMLMSGRVAVLMFMLVRVFVSMIVVVVMAAAAIVVMMFVTVLVVVRFVLIGRVGGPFMNPKLYAFDILPLLPVEMHVKVAEIELRELPFKGGRPNAEIDERTDGHVAADAGKTIEKENAHDEGRGW